ncbi:DUF4199 domain-containing protein [Sphingomonas canadensis]|uniref:DUF4199 domain-containing protein n=1 Tax=Sphingomonas canadensis TaxID=1219257 RepID=A0ABW3H5R4_9SPHN|nr:DUF4199 domain-containing protein [Sphingomonas canadensis]MCW3836565.1 DUF4199 domain-containing protein [Sphingomonas canadensis]
MLKKILTYGAIAGLIAGAPMLALTAWADRIQPELGMVIGYLTMLIAFSTVFVAIKRWRDVEGGGVVRFWPALGMGLGIVALGSLIYAIAWEIALATAGSDFMAEYAAGVIAERKAQGASAAEIAALTAQMESFRAQYANPLFRFAITLTEILPVGLPVALVSAGLLRNPRFLPAR